MQCERESLPLIYNTSQAGIQYRDLFYSRTLGTYIRPFLYIATIGFRRSLMCSKNAPIRQRDWPIRIIGSALHSLYSVARFFPLKHPETIKRVNK